MLYQSTRVPSQSYSGCPHKIFTHIHSYPTTTARMMSSALIIPIATMLHYARSVLVPMQTYGMHKGQGGRVTVMGGSEEYTGAPYYSGISSLKAGGDLASIVCTKHASIPIKSYSPELIVYPYLDGITREDVSRMANKIDDIVLAKTHALVVGPGMGRDEIVMEAARDVMSKARKRNIPIVVDGDGLWAVHKNLDAISGYKHAILTPNANEFRFLYESAFGKDVDRDSDDRILMEIFHFAQSSSSAAKKTKFDDLESALVDAKGAYQGFGPFTPRDVDSIKDISAFKLAQHLGNVTILQKGRVDIITNGNVLAFNAASGSPRRCGGQGDVLAGTTGLFSYYASIASVAGTPFEHEGDRYVLAAFGASLLTRECNRRATAIHHRSTTTPNMIEQIGASFEYLFNASTAAAQESSCESHQSKPSHL